MRMFLIGLALLAVIGPTGADARRRRQRTEQSSGEFAYYMLSLSWAPDFCARPDVQKNDRECGVGRHMGFVVHGLWPQAEEGRSPEQCESARPVASAIVQRMLNYIPSEGLIQHEWKTHGTCSGLASAQYFDLVARAFDSLTIPADYKGLNRKIDVSPSEIERKFAGANPGFPSDAFRTSCGGGDLAEVRVCFTKDLKPRACSDSAGECRMATTSMLPVH
jgi:ribonuclease T2